MVLATTGGKAYDEPDLDPARVLSFRGSDFEDVGARAWNGRRVRINGTSGSREIFWLRVLGDVKHRLVGRHRHKGVSKSTSRVTS